MILLFIIIYHDDVVFCFQSADSQDTRLSSLVCTPLMLRRMLY